MKRFTQHGDAIYVNPRNVSMIAETMNGTTRIYFVGNVDDYIDVDQGLSEAARILH